MEGTLFYWGFWLFWVIATFFLPNQNPYRMKLAATILISIILSKYYLILGKFEMNISGLFLLITSYFFLSHEKWSTIIYSIICSLIISLAYTGFQLLEIFDPVWMIFKREWMLAVGMVFLTILLQNTLKGRLLVVLSGTIQGEVLYSIILNKNNLPHQVSDLNYLDVCSLISILLVIWSLLENVGVIFQNHWSFLEKSKQKSS
ncbi:YphA family membrane protein [Neobacillus thermocopriae]|uniref:YphA family membrane protein n=1 Tax=Neobacillus thermocopriae TaxID=1215031 RepID=UPI002E22E732|nr:hypothetical protein [Neobacillus thermocopriae]MED3715451.1 hypothetical protein [Neobacillus thermocopriae]